MITIPSTLTVLVAATAVVAVTAIDRPGSGHQATPTENLQLSVSIDDSLAPAGIFVTVRNTTTRDWFLPLGFTYAGRVHHDSSFQLVLTTANGESQRLLHVGGPPVIRGRVEPAFTVLPRDATYAFRLGSTDDYVLLEGKGPSTRLSQLTRSGASLRVQFVPNERGCSWTIEKHNPPLLPCWTGAMTSNAVTFGQVGVTPRRRPI